jgi:hypothetical protein
MKMSEYLEFSLDVPTGLLAKQIIRNIPLPVIEKFKEGLRSHKKVNPRYFEEGTIKLRAGDPMQAFNMGCYARTWLDSNSQLLLELLV